jgi:hypothetical protein
VIDAASVGQWETFVKSIFGDKEYAKQAGVW